MTIQVSYSQPLNTSFAIGTTQYAVIIPAGSLGVSGGAVRLSLDGVSTISDIWLGHSGGGTFGLDYESPPVNLKKVGSTSVAMNGVTALDPVTFPLDETKNLVLRFTGRAGGTYKKATGLGSAFKFYYRAGVGGSNSALHAATDYEESVSGVTAFVTAIEVAGSIGDFGGASEPLAPPSGQFDDEEHVVLSGQIFENGGRIEAHATKHLIFALFNPLGSRVHAILREVEITPTADCDIIVCTIVENRADPTTGRFRSRCNSNFRLDPANAPPAKAKLFWTYEDSLIDGNTARHAFKPSLANRTTAIRGAAIAAISPAEQGYGLILPPGVGAAVNLRWREKPIAT